MNTATEPEKALALALIALAGVIFGGMISALPSIVSSLSDNGARLATLVSVAVLIFLAISMALGGRGIAYGPGRAGWGERFNLQALFGAVALLLMLALAGVIFLTAEPSPNKKVAALEIHVADATTRIDSVSRDAASLKSDLAALKNELATLRNKENAFEASIDARLRDIDKSLHSLSDRIQKLEAAPAKP